MTQSDATYEVIKNYLKRLFANRATFDFMTTGEGCEIYKIMGDSPHTRISNLAPIYSGHVLLYDHSLEIRIKYGMLARIAHVNSNWILKLADYDKRFHAEFADPKSLTKLKNFIRTL